MSLHDPRRSYYHKSYVEGRSREVLYTACRISKRTSSDFYGKRTNFSFDKAENTETVYVYIFQSDPRVFSVAGVLACHRETRYGTQITLALSSPLQTYVSLSSADSRSTVLS